ncbi:hypothetical protein VNO77_19275 [Canavalia gladiata]|uniref:Uncharacterized protein n=1 Tax=Canavalia gladiata TaxID=3824 RepID=A0AAN9LR20_CANGL
MQNRRGRRIDDYEYVDVMVKENNDAIETRLIVDMNFRSSFELTKLTREYKRVNKHSFRHPRVTTHSYGFSMVGHSRIFMPSSIFYFYSKELVRKKKKKRKNEENENENGDDSLFNGELHRARWNNYDSGNEEVARVMM